MDKDIVKHILDLKDAIAEVNAKVTGIDVKVEEVKADVKDHVKEDNKTKAEVVELQQKWSMVMGAGKVIGITATVIGIVTAAAKLFV